MVEGWRRNVATVGSHRCCRLLSCFDCRRSLLFLQSDEDDGDFEAGSESSSEEDELPPFVHILPPPKTSRVGERYQADLPEMLTPEQRVAELAALGGAHPLEGKLSTSRFVAPIESAESLAARRDEPRLLRLRLEEEARLARERRREKEERLRAAALEAELARERHRAHHGASDSDSDAERKDKKHRHHHHAHGNGHGHGHAHHHHHHHAPSSHSKKRKREDGASGDEDEGDFAALERAAVMGVSRTPSAHRHGHGHGHSSSAAAEHHHHHHHHHYSAPAAPAAATSASSFAGAGAATHAIQLLHADGASRLSGAAFHRDEVEEVLALLSQHSHGAAGTVDAAVAAAAAHAAGLPAPHQRRLRHMLDLFLRTLMHTSHCTMTATMAADEH